MSGFSVEWLDLRESADQRARNEELLEWAKDWLDGAPSSDPAIVDLGAGTGSTLRAFTGLLNSEANGFQWVLVDRDEGLLAEARRRHGISQPIKTCHANLARISQLPLAGARLVTASALFDLVSAEFVDSFATALRTQSRRQPVGLYAALNYDGTIRWTPNHPLDSILLRAFNGDQRRDKGLGPALGPDACSYLGRQLTRASFLVRSAHSPWVLDGTDRDLVSELIKGIAAAVALDPTVEPKALEKWAEFRLKHVNTGGCVVGHRDLLAVPPVALNSFQTE